MHVWGKCSLDLSSLCEQLIHAWVVRALDGMMKLKYVPQSSTVLGV